MIFLLFVGLSFSQPVVEVFCGPGYYPKNEDADFSGETKFTKCVLLNDTIPEEECTPIFTGGMYKELNVSFNWGGTEWKDGKCVANTCPSVNKNFVTVPDHLLGDGNLMKACNKLGCVTDFKGRKCHTMKLVTFFIIIGVSVFSFIVVCIILCCICCCLCKKKQPVDVAPAEKGAIIPFESGVYVVIKLGTQVRQTKKVKNEPELTWGESIEFVGLGAEDDDASFGLFNDAAIIGTANLRLVDYVNQKTGVSVALKDATGADSLVLEVDVEVVTDETKAIPEIKAVFFVKRAAKAEDKVQVIEEAPADVAPAES